jgi:hypothetical protein
MRSVDLASGVSGHGGGSGVLVDGEEDAGRLGDGVGGLGLGPIFRFRKAISSLTMAACFSMRWSP